MSALVPKAGAAKPPPKVRARLFVVEQVYHQPAGQSPTSVESRFGRWLGSDEQPHLRPMTVGPNWQPLDTGWVGEKVGHIVIANEEGKSRLRQPTEAERQETEAKVVEIGVESDHLVDTFALVRPGETCRFEPAAAGMLRLRCRVGAACCSVAVLPA
jgi:hypothetical protein